VTLPTATSHSLTTDQALPRAAKQSFFLRPFQPLLFRFSPGAVPVVCSSWLITETTGWAKEHGLHSLSLSFEPYTGMLYGHVELSALQRLEREALLVLKLRLELQLDELRLLDRRFNPYYEGRFVVYERRSDLPRVLVASLAAEGYPPFSELARGSDWDRKAPRTSRQNVAFPSGAVLGEPRPEELILG